MRILGIDPGLRTTGFGVLDADGPQLRYVASGVIETTDRAGVVRGLVEPSPTRVYLRETPTTAPSAAASMPSSRTELGHKLGHDPRKRGSSAHPSERAPAEQFRRFRLFLGFNGFDSCRGRQ